MQQQRADDFKWLADTAGRVVGLEGQVRGQTKEAMHYSLPKFADLDARLAATRAELERSSQTCSRFPRQGC